MSVQCFRLKRLHHIKKIVESQRLSDLQYAMARVRHVESAMECQGNRKEQETLSHRYALQIGDMQERGLAEAISNIAESNLNGLHQILQIRLRELSAASNSYLCSRCEQEQVKILVDNIAAQLELKKARNEQRGADEWFSRKYAIQSIKKL
jgi:hypothetical protein